MIVTWNLAGSSAAAPRSASRPAPPSSRVMMVATRVTLVPGRATLVAAPAVRGPP
jgi:hypothetical protein